MGKKIKNISDKKFKSKTAKKKVLNPFEIHINRQKHYVLGRKLKSDRGLPGVSRAKAMKKRKATLLQEYRIKDKANKFLDMRIGEKNRAMTSEDRMLARFTAERVKAHKKKSMYNLAEDEVLTHHGQTLNEIENFDDPRSDEEDAEDSGRLDAAFVEKSHFGGGMLSHSEGGMDRKSLIEQLIAESKRRKAEKQKTREQTTQLTDKLDAEWKDLLPIVSAGKKAPVEDFVKPDSYDKAVRELKFEARGKASDRLKSEEEEAQIENKLLEKLEAERLERMQGFTRTQSKHRSADDLDDGFVLDSDVEVPSEDDEEKGRGVPDQNEDSSPEDSCEEGASDSSDEGDSSAEEIPSKDEAPPSVVSEEMTAERNGEKGNPSKDEAPPSVVSEEITVGRNGEEGNPSKDKASPSVVSKEMTVGRNGEEGNPSKDEAPPSVVSKEITVGRNGEEGKEEGVGKPDASKSLVELSLKHESCMEERLSPEQSSVVQSGGNVPQEESDDDEEDDMSDLRFSTDPEEELEEAKHTAVTKPTQDQIRADLLARKAVMDLARSELPYTFQIPDCYEALQGLLADRSPLSQAEILERMLKCNHPALGKGNKDKLANLFAFLLQHLQDSTSSLAVFEVLDTLIPHLFDLAQWGPNNACNCVAEVLREKYADWATAGGDSFPAPDTLVFLKLVSHLFPTSDFRHPVVTPALVLMEQILHQAQFRQGPDVASGLFLATLILEYTDLSKRFSPGAVNFLVRVVDLAVPIPIVSTVPRGFRLASLPQNLCSEFMKFKDLWSSSELEGAYSLRCVNTALQLLTAMQAQLSVHEASPVVFEPLLAMLPRLSGPEWLQARALSLNTALETTLARALPRLELEKKKPKALRLYEPKIQQVREGRSSRGGLTKETDKLRHKVKREMKGALREIRRDSTFLAKLKMKQTLQSDDERKRKVKEIYGQAANQQGELMKLERIKNRKM